jgi:ubiquinone/menaquinone biosynthesis C-methylase UbiE
MKDKNNIIESILFMEKVVLELGCGKNKKEKYFIGIDILDYPCVDIVGDVFEILKEIPDKSIDKIYTSHFVEHMPSLPTLLTEISRVVKDGGEVEIIVPHFSNPHFYSDYTHKAFFGLYTMSYLSNDLIFKRRVPDYQKDKLFDLESVDLIFKSSRPFYGRHITKKTLGFFFNLSTYLKEFYEENLCYIFPCYEIKYLLRKR